LKYAVNGNSILIILLVTFFTSAILVPIVKKIAHHIGAIDYPDARKVHKKPMPRLGGLAIFLSFLIGYIFFAESTIQMISILIGGFIIILLGIFDDIHSIHARYKFIVQIIAASIVVFYGNIYLPNISAFGVNLSFGAWGYPLAVLFIVAIINAINLIDGLDGLAAGTSSIYFTAIAIIAFALDRLNGLDVTLCLIMLGATLGFLIYNFNPASIFMGDTGSTFLGFMIAVIALLGYKAATVTSLIVPIIILFLPLMDTIFAIIRRLIRGENIGAPDKEHIHHQLLKLNKSTKKTVLIMYGIDALCAAISIFYALGDNQLAIILYIILLVVIVTLIFKTDILFVHHRDNK
jgi:UDP-GlcNAc:undecaprenyl-phosphate/decaprenyl-phosphate GlcNAc-1-phosphate transferase